MNFEEISKAKSEVVDYHEKRLNGFFKDTAHIINRGVGSLSAEEIKDKYRNLFLETAPERANVEKRLRDTLKWFKSWLINEKNVKFQDAEYFCSQILRILLSNEVRIGDQIKPDNGKITQFSDYKEKKAKTDLDLKE